MNDQEIETLIDALLENEISEADFLRLEAEMQLRPEARAIYYEKLRLDSLLQTEAEGAGRQVGTPRRHVPWRRVALAAAAAVALISSALSGWIIGKRPGTVAQNPRDTASEPAASGFAVVAETADAVWESATFGRGDLLPVGELELNSGIVKLDLFSGVAVAVEGAAKFELLSPMDLRIAHGKVRAVVPEPAHGFRVHTASGELVDLGTEFVIDVGDEHADLHVLDGEIEWHPKSAEMRNLKQGEAIRWDSGGARALELEARRMSDIEFSLQDRLRERREAWVAHVEERKSDPRLIAYYPMHLMGGWERTLPDESGGSHDGAIVQAKHVADRWDQPYAALDFSPTGSRARLILPGEYRSLTFICWAKIDSLDRWFNSLFLTDGHELNEPHWQIMDDGRLFFSVKKREWKSKSQPDKHIFYSPPFWDQSMSGKWIMIATVYDVEAEQVSHYIDGAQISREAVPDGYLVEKVTIGAASIGNWSEPRHRTDPKFAVRNLNGSIDEFAIYSAALSADEISKLYQIGKP